MSTVLYSIKYLREALQKAKLPFSKPTVLRYEKLGIISTPRTPTENGMGTGYRFFTREEIEQAVQKVKAFVNSKK